MNPDFWHQKWQRNEIGFHVPEANPLLVNAFHKLSLKKGRRVFLPLCGKTLDIAWLLDQGYQVVGIELNASAIQQLFAEMEIVAKVSRMGELTLYHAENLDIFVGDFFALSHEVLGPVDAVYDRAALVALPDAMRKRYTQHLMALTDKAPQLLITYEYDQQQIDGPPFSVDAVEVHGHYDESYTLSIIHSQAVPGGFKGQYPASEHVWLLKARDS